MQKITTKDRGVSEHYKHKYIKVIKKNLTDNIEQRAEKATQAHGLVLKDREFGRVIMGQSGSLI